MFIINMLQTTANEAESHDFICIKTADIIVGMGCWGRSMFLPYKIVVGVEGRGVTA